VKPEVIATFRQSAGFRKWFLLYLHDFNKFNESSCSAMILPWLRRGVAMAGHHISRVLVKGTP
jgi:hypothetical protein